jgi:hypothetical protein
MCCRILCCCQMLQDELSLKVLLWSQVVDLFAPATPAPAATAAEVQHKPLAAASSSNNSSLLGTLGARMGSSRSGISSRQVSSAAAEAAAEAGAACTAEAAVALLKGVDILLVDVPSELPLMYSVSEVVFVGNSLLEGCGGHNLAEAAVAGCAVLVGEHAGHFNTMADELNQAAVRMGRCLLIAARAIACNNAVLSYDTADLILHCHVFAY